MDKEQNEKVMAMMRTRIPLAEVMYMGIPVRLSHNVGPAWLAMDDDGLVCEYTVEPPTYSARSSGWTAADYYDSDGDVEGKHNMTVLMQVVPSDIKAEDSLLALVDGVVANAEEIKRAIRTLVEAQG